MNDNEKESWLVLQWLTYDLDESNGLPLINDVDLGHDCLEDNKKKNILVDTD